MTEELHLRISGKGCWAGLGEVAWQGLLCPHVPVSPCPSSHGQRDDDVCVQHPLDLAAPPPTHCSETPEKGLELLLPLPSL